MFVVSGVAAVVAVMAGAPEAILLPGSIGGPSVQQLSAKLAVREAEFSLADGATRIIAVADRAQSLFNMGSYRGSSTRLWAIAWSAESLRAEIGAVYRDLMGRSYPAMSLYEVGLLEPGALVEIEVTAVVPA